MRSFVLYGVIIAVTALVALNPLTAWLLTGTRSFALYLGALDLCLLVLVAVGLLHLRRGGVAWFAAFCVVAAGILPAMVVAEAVLVYVQNRYGAELTGQIAEIYEPDPLLVYTHLPDATGRHVSFGNFDVEYRTDAEGRKAIAQNPDAERGIHVFGDSFTFGYGAANDDTWLNLLSQRLGERINVLNYGVVGYSLEQMVLSLERYQDEIAAGDLVLFTPISADLERSLVGRTYVCGGMIRAEANETFPKLVDGEWRAVPLREACNPLLDTLLGNSPLPVSFGALYRSYRQRATYDDMIANAERLFEMARAMAAARGAAFQVVFLATPQECMVGSLTIDVAPIAFDHHSLLPACPADAKAVQALKFPQDGHWSPRGHQWAADALHEVLADLPALTADRAETSARGS